MGIHILGGKGEDGFSDYTSVLSAGHGYKEGKYEEMGVYEEKKALTQVQSEVQSM